MNRENLYEILRKEGTSLKTAKIIVDSFFEEITNGIINDKKILIKNFASFSTKQKKSMVVINNKLHQKIEVPEHKVVRTKFSKQLQKQLSTIKDTQ